MWLKNTFFAYEWMIWLKQSTPDVSFKRVRQCVNVLSHNVQVPRIVDEEQLPQGERHNRVA